MNWVNPIKIPAELKRLGLGQAADPNLDAWAQMITALRDSVQLSWNAAKASYLGLKKVREDLGLPFIAAPSGETDANVGAWGADLDQQAVDLQAINTILINAANDVLENKRKLIWDPTLKEFVIEALPDDVVRVENVGGKPTLVLITTGAATHSTGTIGIAPLAIGAGVAVLAVVAGIGLYSLVKDTNATMRSLAEQKTTQTLSNNQVKMIEKGATPEQAAQATKAVTDGVASIKEADAKLEQAKAGGKDVDAWTNLIKTGGFIALGLGVLYIVAQLVPKGGVRSTAPAMPMQENRRRRRRRSNRTRTRAAYAR